MQKKLSAMAISALLVMGAIHDSAEAAKWKVTEIGPTAGQARLFLNNAGQVAGTYTTDGATYGPLAAFFTGPNGANRRDVYSSSPLQSAAYGINDKGILLTVIGQDVADAEGWTQQTSDTKSATLAFRDIAKSTYMYDAGAINNAGTIVGRGTPIGAAPQRMTFLITPNGAAPVTLAVDDSSIMDINESGQVITRGSAFCGATITGPNGTSPRLLTGDASGNNCPVTWALNDAGQVVGYHVSAQSTVAVVTGTNGKGATALGTLGSKQSIAYGINNAGQIVGDYGDNFSLWHAFITDAGGKNPRDLNNEVTLPVGYLTTAWAINDKGQVVASDYYNQKAYLLTPVPECTVTYKVLATSKSRFSAAVTIANTSSSAKTGWSAGWTFGSVTPVQSVVGAKLTIKNLTAVSAVPVRATTVAAGSSATFTFTAAKGNSLPAVKDLQGSLGGQACAASLQ
jgi:uncharacterized membrane protein